MSISVVIPCLNEENYIGSILSDLVNQTVQPKLIVVADCGSNDNTVKVAKSFEGELPIKVVYSEVKRPGVARNRGAAAVRSEFMLFLDADARIHKDFVKGFAERLSQSGADLASPRFKSSSKHPNDLLHILMLNWWLFYNLSIRKRAAGVTATMIVKTQAHHDVGGFNEDLREFEDVDYVKKFRTAGKNIIFDYKSAAVFSNRRFVEQGRIKSSIQEMPPDKPLYKKLRSKLGITEKFDN